jgi:hypothetical protein
MRSRFAVLALLVLLLGATGLTACGDVSSTTGTRGGDTPKADPKEGRRSQAKLVPSARPPGARRGHSAEEYRGAFADGKEICGTSTHEKVAKIVGSRSTRSAAIASALARGYKPKLRKQAYAGCLAGLR